MTRPARDPQWASRLGADRVTRAFGPVVALDEVSLEIWPGTIHCIVGENGAGKTTLMRILSGLDQPDSGAATVDGSPIRWRGPAHALRAKVGLVQQELALIGELTLQENLVLGAEPRRGPFVDRHRMSVRASVLASLVGLDIDWNQVAADAPVSVQQQVEILRLMHRGADVLILDEPTAALAPAQVSDLLRLLRELRDQGKTVVFISHKLDEVLAIADEITVIRGGRVISTVDPSAVDRASLAEMIVGEQVPTTTQEPGVAPGATVMEVSNLAAEDDRGIRRLDGVSFAVRAGEVVGVAGVAGNGQDELVECLVGLRRAGSGRIRVRGDDVTARGVAARRTAGLAYISADRKGEGLALTASLTENVVAGFHRGRLSRRGWMSGRRVGEFVRSVLDGYGVRHGSARDPAATLSGGNQQRLVVGREFSHEPAVLVAAQPGRGVDVKGIAFIHEQLRQLCSAGTGVLLVSEDLDELLQLTDRILVLYRGRVAGELPRGASRQDLGQLMLGGQAAVA